MRKKLTEKEKAEVKKIKDPIKRVSKMADMGAYDDGIYPDLFFDDDDDDDFLYGLFPQK